MKFRLSARADIELRAIYIESRERFGLVQAESYVAGLREKLALLGDTPGVARQREELVGRARAYRYKAHMIIYREEEDDGILVIRLPHARSDWINDPD